MVAQPVNWIASATEILGARNPDQAGEILRAWQSSTPLPPNASNPLGMPASSRGATSWHGTGYACFDDLAGFLAALTDFAVSYAGQGVTRALNSDLPWRNTWQAVAALGWPASKTETDYPAAVLDNTGDSYRESVGATLPEDRKTSGLVGGMPGAPVPHPQHISAVGQQVAYTNAVLGGLRNRT